MAYLLLSRWGAGSTSCPGSPAKLAGQLATVGGAAPAPQRRQKSPLTLGRRWGVLPMPNGHTMKNQIQVVPALPAGIKMVGEANALSVVSQSVGGMARRVAGAAGGAVLALGVAVADTNLGAAASTYVTGADAFLTSWQAWVLGVAGFLLVVRGVKKAFRG